MIHFITPGAIDLRLVSTFGVNVKPASGSSPIGYFGTGLKYAIAVLLRTDHTINLQTAGKEYAFSISKESIRGKEFDLCHYQEVGTGQAPVLLPFTLELGKDWSVQDAYRELYSNTKDERGTIEQCAHDHDVTPGVDMTIFTVAGTAIEEVHNNRDSFILREAMGKIYVTEEVEVIPFTSEVIFYRGIAALTLSKPSRFTYNILKPMELTENRTLYHWQVEGVVERMLGSCTEEKLLSTALIDNSYWEHDLNLTYVTKTQDFYSAIAKLVKSHPSTISPSASRALFASNTLPITYEAQAPTPGQTAAIKEAVIAVLSCGIPILQYPINISESLGANVMACAYNGQIWITPRCFESKELLLAALLEEFVHLRYSVTDETRAMQDAVFNMLARVIMEKGDKPAPVTTPAPLAS